MSENDGGSLQEVVNAREQLRASDAARLPVDTAKQWMQDDDIETLGALYHTLTDPVLRNRIDPPLDPAELDNFLRGYFGRCLREDPQGGWCNSRYSAGWDLAAFLAAAWGDRSEEALSEWKEWLGKLFLDGGKEVRECLINATLEHLFEDKRARSFFADWKEAEQGELATAYDEAVSWSASGGRSPLTPSQ